MQFRRATPEDAESILQFWNDSEASIGATDELRHVRRRVTSPPLLQPFSALLEDFVRKRNAFR
jgi:hypothetical protein